jgi:predicted PurR-regulated permease PerM
MDGQGSTRILTRLWMLALGVVAITVLYLAKVLFLPLAFAILFAFLLAPLVSRLEHIHLPRTLAALVVILAFATLLGCAGWVLFMQLVGIANDLPTYRDNISQKVAAAHAPSNSPFSRAEREIERLGDQFGIANSSNVPTTAVKSPDRQKPLGASPDHPIQVREVSHSTARLDQLGGVLEPLTTALLSVVFTFFVLLQREDLRNRLIRLSGDRHLTLITQAMDDAGWRVSRYFRLQLLVNTIYGCIVFLVLYSIGLPHSLLFAVVASVLRFVPYVGWMAAALLPTALSLAVFHGWEKSLLIAGTFLCLEVITGNYIEPRVYGKHTGLSSLAILIAAAFWTLLWGPVGLVLSVPLTVCLVVMGRHVPAVEFLTVMLGDKPAIPQWMCFYQRLLARDAAEASKILDSALHNQSLEEAFDSVLVPALVMSEEDRQHNDLEESTVRFIRQAARDLIEEAGFHADAESDTPDQVSLLTAQTGGAAAARPLKIHCVPVRGETDELAAMMLGQVLESEEMQARCFEPQRIDEIAAAVEAEQPQAVFLTALPPVGMARCHRIYRTLRARHPELRILVGIWNFPDDPVEAARKITSGQEPRVWTRLADALAEVRLIGGERPDAYAIPGESAA